MFFMFQDGDWVKSSHHPETIFYSELVFAPHFLIVVVEVKPLGTQHIWKLWLVVRNDMLTVEYFHSNNILFVAVEFFEDHKTFAMLR